MGILWFASSLLAIITSNIKLDSELKEFKTFLYSDVWIPDGVNLNLRTSIEKICEDNNVTHFWATKGGESDGIMPTNAKSIAACIFRMDEPHGDIYSGICEYISDGLTKFSIVVIKYKK